MEAPWLVSRARRSSCMARRVIRAKTSVSFTPRVAKAQAVDARSCPLKVARKRSSVTRRSAQAVSSARFWMPRVANAHRTLARPWEVNVVTSPGWSVRWATPSISLCCRCPIICSVAFLLATSCRSRALVVGAVRRGASPGRTRPIPRGRPGSALATTAKAQAIFATPVASRLASCPPCRMRSTNASIMGALATPSFANAQAERAMLLPSSGRRPPSPTTV
mmetsp:Transcript_86631/g.150828  ORF Transcript_86631/g.150828 Transcript_86631/m.150828 type:complete len:221 (-) Transcript_86631:877-1539(-)